MYSKRIDELGRVVIPKPIRNKLGIVSDDFVEIKLIDNKIEIQKDLGLQNNNNYENMIKLIKKVYNFECVLCNTVKIKQSTIQSINYNDLITKEMVKVNNEIYKINKFVINNNSKIEGYLYILNKTFFNDDIKQVIKNLIIYFTDNN